MFNFYEFIEESYLDSSKAPLYHYILSVNFKDDIILLPIFTNIFKILKKNKIKILKDGKEFRY